MLIRKDNLGSWGMSGEANDGSIKRLLQQAIVSVELAMELMGKSKVKESKKPSLILTRIAKQKLAEIEARQHQQPQDSL